MSVSLADATAALQSIAPLEYAEEWDNVGLLIEPSRPRPIKRVMLTIDLTSAVVAEAIKAKADLVVAYHPPIFDAIKRINGKLVPLIETRVAVYSPHTALDAVPGGVNDWLCDGLGVTSRSAWHVAKTLPRSQQMKVVTFVPPEHADRVRAAMAESGAGRIGDYSQCSFNAAGFGTFLGGASTNPTVGKKGRLERADELRLEMVCAETALAYVIESLRGAHPYEEPAFEVYRLEPRPMRDTGAGRLAHFRTPITLNALVGRIKRHLKIEHVRVAAPDDVRRGRRKIDELGICAGAGGSLFDGTLVQAYLTGEMRHHDILAKIERGGTVILCDHTNTERGYLPVLRAKLREKLGRGVRIDIAKSDAEPLRIV